MEYVPSPKVEEESKPERGRSSRSTRSARSVKSARSASKVRLSIGEIKRSKGVSRVPHSQFIFVY